MEEVNQEEIETLFKVEPPLQAIEGGFGYIGVVLRNRATDRIQCHACGKWFKVLNTRHLQSSHGLGLEEYKVKYGLPLGFPLCSRGFSESQSKSNIEKRLWKNLDGKRDWNKCQSKVRKWALKRMRKSPAFLNSLGICEEQIKQRFVAVAETIGGEPGQNDLIEHDPKLWAVIRRRYNDSINLFKEKNGFNVSDFAKRAGFEYTDKELLYALRGFYKKHSRMPVSNDFRIGSPNAATYRNRFGSWSRALAKAGLVK